MKTNRDPSPGLLIKCGAAALASATGAFLMMLTFGLAPWAFSLILLVAVFTFGTVGDHRFALLKSVGGWMKLGLTGLAVLLLWAVLEIAHSAFLAFWCFHAVFIAAEVWVTPGRPTLGEANEIFANALRQANAALERLETQHPYSH